MNGRIRSCCHPDRSHCRFFRWRGCSRGFWSPDTLLKKHASSSTTSSPGLKGQGGGPIVDILGQARAIQSHTRHHSPGFSPEIPGTSRVEHKLLNVGIGVHADPVEHFLNEQNIALRRAEFVRVAGICRVEAMLD